jgi:hypothetical protein
MWNAMGQADDAQDKLGIQMEIASRGMLTLILKLLVSPYA